MTDQQKVMEHLNTMREQFLDDLGCVITAVDTVQRTCHMDFNVDSRYCHSGDIIQGGFVTAMLDACTTHATFAANQNITGVATLELKVSFLEASRLGKLSAVGRVDKLTRSIAFMSGELYNSEGLLTASISTTAKLRTAE